MSLKPFAYTKEALQKQVEACKSVNDFMAFRTFLELDGYFFVSKKTGNLLGFVSAWPPVDLGISSKSKAVKLVFPVVKTKVVEGVFIDQPETILCYIRNVFQYVKLVSNQTGQEMFTEG